MDTSESRLVWFKTIEKLQTEGALLCPLMLQEPCRFDPRIVLCDIPETRQKFLKIARYCHSSERCLARVFMPPEASRELEKKE